MWKCLPIALCLPTLSACSSTQYETPMPPPPANLAQECKTLPPPPLPLIDPDRMQWEADLVYAYGECAARHRAAIEAWQKAVQTSRK